MARLEFFVPSNRRDRHGHPTHVDGFNEIIRANRHSRDYGCVRERENVSHVAACARRAMRAQHFGQPECEVRVRVTFVERDERRDLSNVYGGLKWVLDGLSRPRGSKKIGAGAIRDDSRRWVKVIPDVETEREGAGREDRDRDIGGRMTDEMTEGVGSYRDALAAKLNRVAVSVVCAGDGDEASRERANGALAAIQTVGLLVGCPELRTESADGGACPLSELGPDEVAGVVMSAAATLSQVYDVLHADDAGA